MDKFLLFDQFLDSVFVVKETTEIVFANRVAADLCGLSQKRLIGKKKISDLFEFDSFPFPFNKDSLGYGAPSPYLETGAKSLSDKGKSGRLQMSVAPWAGGGEDELWIFIFHDVSLEESLHSLYRSELEQKEGYIADLESARAELEKYSKNLEEIVSQRTAELRQANRNLQAIIDSLGQGFLTFSKDLQCGDLYTKACEDLLETRPAARSILDVLKVEEAKRAEFKMWTETLFGEMLPFDDLKSLGPQWFESGGNRSIYMEYFPIREEGGGISDVVLVATDKTQEVEAQKKLENEKSVVDMILKFVRGRNLFVRFLKSVPETLHSVERLLPQARQKEAELFRILHTLEGEAGTFSLQKLRTASREPQQLLQGKPKGWEELLKVSLDQLKESYREAVQTVEGFFGPVLQASEESVTVSFAELEALALTAERRFRNKDLAAEIRKLKFQEQIISAFNHYDGLVQNLSEKLGKKIAPIHFEGGNLRVDLRPLRGLSSAFVHVIRNMADHGIESPEERELEGKNPEGRITIKFELQKSVLRIEASDDGRGIDPEIIRRKLQNKFPGEDFSALSDEEIQQEIFRPGFSSREEVGEYSGRGVGMDAVREEVAKMGGTVRVFSQVGSGTGFVFTLPLSVEEEDLKRSA
jgi:two-component system chemotaxis sensor kinase CheA